MKTKMKNVEEGTVILTEKPFIYVLSSKLRTQRCDHCFEKKKVFKCSGCQYVYYCGRDCQKESWSIHKIECPKLREIAPRVLPDAARLLAKLVIKLKTGGDLEKGYYTPTSYRTFKELMSHYSDIKADVKRMDHFTSLCAVLIEYLGETFLPNSAELLGIYGRMCVNGFNILDPEMTSIGTGIYLAASVIDHSCKPNALAVFEGTTIHIRTLDKLPVLDWSKVFITYIELLNTPEERQEELQATYYFRCHCFNCLDVKQYKDMHSAACPNNRCDALIDMNNPDEQIMECESCKEPIDDELRSRYKDAEEFTNTQLQNMKTMAYLDVCKKCLEKQENIFHPVNLLRAKTLDLSFESSMEVGLWDDAQEFGMLLLPCYRKYYGDFHPLLGLLYLKIAKILIFKNKSSEAIKYLKEARKILRVTHGESHSLFKKYFLPLMEQAAMESDIYS